MQARVQAAAGDQLSRPSALWISASDSLSSAEVADDVSSTTSPGDTWNTPV